MSWQVKFCCVFHVSLLNNSMKFTFLFYCGTVESYDSPKTPSIFGLLFESVSARFENVFCWSASLENSDSVQVFYLCEVEEQKQDDGIMTEMHIICFFRQVFCWGEGCENLFRLYASSKNSFRSCATLENWSLKWLQASPRLLKKQEHPEQSRRRPQSPWKYHPEFEMNLEIRGGVDSLNYPDFLLKKITLSLSFKGGRACTIWTRRRCPRKCSSDRFLAVSKLPQTGSETTRWQVTGWAPLKL